jgi:hypothetical protein
LRRTTTAWIAGTLGAGLTASIVLAQQLPSSGSSRAGSTGSGSSTPTGTPSLYGAAGTRGARYLMRNGLDYLNYQQYERALKFLREAEAKQGELTAPEIVTLKEGIERARDGLRAGADAGTSYALSEQARGRNGFTAAQPESLTAQRFGPSARSARTKARPSVAASPGSDEGPGEPIRLASAEAPVGDSPARPDRSGPVKGGSTTPDALPAGDEIPALTAPEIPTLTAVPTSTDPAGPASVASPTANQGASPTAALPVPQDPAITGAALATDATAATALNPEPSPASASPTGPAPGTPAAPATEPASGPQSATASSPAASPPAKAPAPIMLETLETPSSEPAPTSAHTPASASAPPSGGLVPTAMQGAAPAGPASSAGGIPATAGGRSPATAEIDAIPLPPLGAATSAADSPAAPSHSEIEEPAAIPPPASGADELPPLPGDLARDDAATHPTGGVPTASTPAPSEPPASPAPSGAVATHAEDESLPPLPVGVEAPAPIASEPAPVATTTAPAMATPPGEAPRDPVEPGFAAQASAESSPTAALPAEPPGAVLSDSTSPPTGGTYPLTGTAPGSDAPPAAPGDTPAAKPDTTAPSAGSRRANAPPISADINFTIPERAAPVSILNDELKRRVEEVARSQEKDDEMRSHAQQNRAQPDAPVRDNSSSTLQTQTQLDISRAPSPAEARPIKAIPVPEDWVPLAARSWAPQRKYWAAAATCHLPLYFQDPVLERYGHSVEQFVGPLGRYLSYPVDDPAQSTQRNQIIQPFFSWGLFWLQIAAWPYNAIMDPPWEAQYDLGYYRPGDMIPVDTYWLPLHGYGPPLRGNRY